MGLRHPMKREVELHIEELVLVGFPPGDRFAVADALERELQRLVEASGPGALRSTGGLEQLDGGTFRVAPGSRAQAIGGQLGQSVFRALTERPRAPGRREGRPGRANVPR